MRRFIVSVGLLFAFALFLSFSFYPSTLQAEVELAEGMTQGDFGLWLVKAVGAQAKLPPAATGEDAIAFLSGLGVIPEGGWQKDELITNELLAGLLSDSEGSSNLSFDELVEKVRQHVQSIFDEAQLGVFRAMSSGTPSVPA